MTMADTAPSGESVVTMRGITKRFPGVLANDRVDFELRRGEIHALLGENGAGKTTLMSILCGLYTPDAGELLLNNQPVHFRSAADAINAGIGMVHQHFMLVERFSVAENLTLGERGKRGLLRERPERLHARLRDLAAKYAMQIDPAAPVWQLSVGERQRVEILKALARGAQVLILDEPTAVLTPQEVDELLPILRSLAAGGTSIIFITHKLNEVLAVCDHVTVLRDGRTVGSGSTAGHTARDLARMMVDREIQPVALRTTSQPGAALLALHGVRAIGDHGREALGGIDLDVRAGEIVGVAGVDGNGQRELEEAIVGLRTPSAGTITIEGPLAHIPSDRYSMGLLPDFSVAENLALRDIARPPYTEHGLLQPAMMTQQAVARAQQFDIRAASVHVASSTLSGGNAQKIILARELGREHRVVLAAQPTRGLDVGAIAFVHNQLLEQRDAGAAVLLISTELEEILQLSDRIAVLYEGQIVGMVDRAGVDVEQLGLMMAGRSRG